MADELGAVLEAPEVTSADEVVEQVNDTPTESAQDEQPAPEQVEVKGDERVLPQWIRNLKATDPAAFKEAKGVFFGHRSITDKLKDFDLDGTKAFLEEHGGRESLASSITELRGKAEELDGISQKMANGDPSLISDLIESSPDGFAKLAPVVADHWAKADPEGWGAAMSGVMAATIQQNGVPLFLEKMGMMLEFGKTEEAVKMLNDLKGWAGSFAEKAAAPRQTARQAPQTDKLSAREQELNQREARAFNDEMRRDVDNFRDPLIAKELDSFAKRRPNDTDAKQLAMETVRSQVVDQMAKDTAFQKSLNALTARKDKEGALRLIKSREAAAIAIIAPKVGRMIFGTAGPAQTADKKPVTAQKPDAGFALVDRPPKPETIDRFRTTDAMIMRGQFILKDGRKLTLEA
jgi:hypothetical protein